MLPKLQELPPKWARFCLGVGSFAAQELGLDFRNATCLVACSGGADSTALLLIAALLCPMHSGRVMAAHLDHGLRDDSSQDARFVAELCEKWNIPLASERQDVAALATERGIGLEEAGRLARYDLLERVRARTGAEIILLGHQLNDLAEDQLMRLTRGGGWPALGGMVGFDASRRLLRPLLLTPRAILEEFLTISGVPWCTDASNFEGSYMRNRMRQELVPVLLRENPAYLDSVSRLWRQARLDEIHWQAETERVLAQLPCVSHNGTLLLSAEVLNLCPAPLRLRVYKAALETLGPGQALSDGLFRLDELWRVRATGKKLRFPGDKEARVTQSGIAFQVIDRKKECG
ncbi:MAG TPA: tRNA lysidine(34) synthetase TilS [Humidesulfovibrio sp.]|uniref:tRNA lysidine(34) synthetase TilS n=1 Tax=Humidesulfovibrio sp. TaxID=2910988 RepID=UPI002D05EAB5|nr:tRNA lysidine(34) synthetase TilS [Humidesulfovibrio sp.]HWR04217.1 tRNA lysidine(34) synthetase TilS [Humidesulfovibrio sp.]